LTVFGQQAQTKEGNRMTPLGRFFLVACATLCLEVICRAETLKVQVLDSKTGAPIRATVNAVGTLPRIDSALTNQEGVAILSLPSLEHVAITVRTSTHGEQCVGEEETKEGVVVVRMEPSLRVFGVVRDPSGNPLRQATVKLVYKEDPKCRIRFDRPDVVTNERGEYVLRNVDVSKDPTILVRHDLFVERAITNNELLAAPAGPFANTKEIDVELAARP